MKLSFFHLPFSLLTYFFFFILNIDATNKDIQTNVVPWRPVVLMHGLLADAEAMSHAQGWIEADFPGIYILNVEIGNGRDDSMFMNINDQVDSLANSIRLDPKLKNGFNLIGHSQGGLLTRAYVERYNNPPVYNLISWAGPNDGVYGVPDLNALCPDEYCPWLNDIMDLIMDGGWIDDWVQTHIAFASYWKDPFNYDHYIDYNSFLADINNEKLVKNATYKQNLVSLNTYTLLYSTIDEIVVPTISPWFYFFKNNSETEIQPLKDSAQYQYDWIGLKTLDQAKKLNFYSIQCHHQDIPRDICKQYYEMYTKHLLNNTLPIH